MPYNPYLTLKYNAHINVEICTSLAAIKYICKYIFKGYDCACIAVTSDSGQMLRYDEITNYLSCRYVSPPEAIWRLRESKMHDRSHTVMRLPVHLPGMQVVRFEDGNEEEALLAAQSKLTKLEYFFELNKSDQNARGLLYTKLPESYVYATNKWKRRQRGANKVVTRMYSVSPKDEERFYLRTLLLHVRGPESFEDEWLLKLGEGSLPKFPSLRDPELIQLPQHMIEKNSLVDAIFTRDISELSDEQLSSRVIVAATNA